MKKIFIIIFCILLSFPVFSTTIFETFDTLVNESDLIIVGKVKSGKIMKSGSEYVIEIQEVLKGSEHKKQIKTIQKYGIKIGMDYLFLLKKEGNMYVDFFEGMTKFEIEYDTINHELDYCISIPNDIIGIDNKEFVIEKDTSSSGELWNSNYYLINEIKEYIKKIVQRK